MKKLILHIGNHKTGTTTIQWWLFENKKRFEEYGISCFFDSSSDKIKKNSMNYFDHSQVSTYGVKIKSGLVQALKLNPKEKILMSSEAFSWIFEKKELQKFKKELENYFNDIKIVVYIRRQDRQAISHYQQGCRAYGVEGKFYSGNFTALPIIDHNAIKYLDYDKRLSIWGDVFGDENIDIRVFDRTLLKNGDIVSDFAEYLRVDDSLMTKPKEKNISLGFEETKVNHLMREAGLSEKRLFNNLVNQEVESSYKMLPSKKEAKEFYETFLLSNRRLNKRFKVNKNINIFDDNFNLYPDISKQHWTEDSANKVFSTIFSIANMVSDDCLSGILNRKTVDFLRDTALEYKDKDINLAYELMLLASIARPKGTFIQDSLKTLKIKKDKGM